MGNPKHFERFTTVSGIKKDLLPLLISCTLKENPTGVVITNMPQVYQIQNL